MINLLPSRLRPLLAILALFAADAAWADEVADVWNTPEFQRRFADALLVESAVVPPVEQDERETLVEVQRLLGQRKYDEAESILKREIDAKSSAWFDFLLGGAYFNQERFEDAVSEYTAATGKFPSFQQAWSMLGASQLGAGRPVEAVGSLARAYELGAKDFRTLGLIAKAHLETENWLAAEFALRNLIMLDPAQPEWQAKLAQTYFKQGRYAETASMFGSLINRYPDEPRFWKFQADAFVRMGEPMRAAENYEILVGLGLGDADAFEVLANIYANEGLADVAVDYYIQAFEASDAPDPTFAFRAAENFVRRGMIDDVSRLLEHVRTEMDEDLDTPQRTKLRRLSARIAVARGEGEEQARILEEIVSIDPTDGEALVLLGRYHAGKGDYPAAIAWLERAALNPEVEAEAKLRHAETLVRQGKYAPAIPLLRAYLQQESNPAVQLFFDQVSARARAAGKGG